MQLLPKQEHAIYYLNDDETEELLYGGGAGGGNKDHDAKKAQSLEMLGIKKDTK